MCTQTVRWRADCSRLGPRLGKYLLRRLPEAKLRCLTLPAAWHKSYRSQAHGAQNAIPVYHGLMSRCHGVSFHAACLRAARGRLAPACTTSRDLEGDRPTGMYGVYNIHSHIAKSILQIPDASAFPPIIPNYLPAPAPRVNCLSFFSGGLAPFYICDLTSRNSLAENRWTRPGNTTNGVQHPEAVCPAADGPLRLRRRRRVQPRPAV